jgi:hypothetical protein
MLRDTIWRRARQTFSEPFGVQERGRAELMGGWQQDVLFRAARSVSPQRPLHITHAFNVSTFHHREVSLVRPRPLGPGALCEALT